MSKTLKILLIVLGVIVVFGGGILAYLKYGRSGTVTSAVSPSASSAMSASPSGEITPISDSGVTWIPPQVLGDQNFIKVSQDTGISGVKYYKVADLSSGGSIILASLEFEGPSLPVLYRFKKSSDGQISYLMRQSSEKEYGVVSKILAAGVNIDNDTLYQSLSAPDFMTVSNTKLKASTNVGLFANLENKEINPTSKEIGTTAYGKMYQRIIPVPKEDMGGMIFALRLADSSYRDYTLKFDFLTDDEVAQITWSDGTTNTAKYTSESYVGCAMTTSDNVIVKVGNASSRLTEAGKTKEGVKVYTLTKDDSIMKLAYENYKGGREQAMTLEEFAAKKPVFVWKDGLGDYIILTGRDFKGLAECGKPVIYLYPEKETKVSVKVGAKITQSDPTYNDGWEVIASPEGTLNLAGKIYRYLYWEGTGQSYPIINAGTIVKNADIQNTLKTQLKELGLNQKESADFLEFWMPKMPGTPYVRLTWFGTQEMNKLAPLSITPAPDTVIRVFLDFEGLQLVQAISPQKLSAPKRNGFTVIEWGGLLR